MRILRYKTIPIASQINKIKTNYLYLLNSTYMFFYLNTRITKIKHVLFARNKLQKPNLQLHFITAKSLIL